MKKIISIIIVCSFVGCASFPSNIKPAYVSPLKYDSYTCDQIKQEHDQINKRIAELTKKQKRVSTIDAISMGVGLVLFWPALAVIAFTGDNEIELARFKGDYEIIKRTAIEKQCDCASEGSPE